SPADQQTYLKVHNAERAKHGAKALTWNATLATKAQQWANKCHFEHSGGSLACISTENLAAGTGDYTITDAINGWDNEESQYNPSSPQYSHWTQVVWKGTHQLGCAEATCNGIFDPKYGAAKYYVCEYYPAGNVIGEFA
ncbi:PR-1-like protein, partial [Coniophora puteana RWD-64-598 SS2]